MGNSLHTLDNETYIEYQQKHIEALERLSESFGPSDSVKFVGVTTTELTDGATTSVIVVNGENIAATAGAMAIYGDHEFIFNGTAWKEFGYTAPVEPPHINHNYEDNGRNLKEIFGTASAFHNAIADGDFSDIQIGDYWPVTLNGTFKDYSLYEVPVGTTYYQRQTYTQGGNVSFDYVSKGTTSAPVGIEYGTANSYKPIRYSSDDNVTTSYYIKFNDNFELGVTRAINETQDLVVSAINPYWSNDRAINHILLSSKNVLSGRFTMNSALEWYDDSESNPWKGSALYRTLNDDTYGLIKVVEMTDIGQYVYSEADVMQHQTGMHIIMNTYASNERGAESSPEIATSITRGKLFLPTENELSGRLSLTAAVPNDANLLNKVYQILNKWPIFEGSTRYAVKKNDSNVYSDYWTQSDASGLTFIYVTPYGTIKADNCTASKAIPLCFIVH